MKISKSRRAAVAPGVWSRSLASSVLLAAAAVASTAAAASPRLLVDRTAGATAVQVEHARGARVTLRETEAAVQLGRAGSDPAGRVLFADWSEDGRRFFSLSRDGGATWSQAEGIETGLLLHDGDAGVDAAMPAALDGLAQEPEARLFLVQFRTLSLEEWRAAIEDLGGEVLAYFPHNAHVVRLPPAQAREAAGLDIVQRVEPYHPSYRIERGVRDWLLGGGPQDAEELRVHVMALEWGPDAKERIAAAAEHAGAKVVQNDPSGQVIDLLVDRDQLRAIAALDDVMWIDRWTPPSNDMDLVRQDSGANWLETNHGQCGQGVRGEVMDSGIQANHQDFDGVMFHGSNDVSSHGTSTYGIVFGNGNRDGDGNAQATGHMASAGACTSQGIFADYGFLTDRFAHTQRLKNSPYFASFQSNSWGSTQTTAYTSDSHALDDIIWRLDIAIAQSQSNTGNQNSRPQAWAKNIISVGGIRHYGTASTADDAWAGGASIGPAADGRIKPDVNYWYDNVYTTTSGSASSYTTSFGGTSAATPEVAGVLGLMVQMWSDNVWGTNPSGTTVFQRQPHASTIKALLINNANQYPFSGTTHDLTRTHQGWGRPNVQVARQRAASSFIVDHGTPLQVGQAATYGVTVAAGQSELKVTMVYPDPPGTTSATQHRINDLSLKVTSPSGTVYHGNNGLLAGNYSTSGGSPNTIDTVENVFVQSPASGTWSIEVRAAAINQDAYPATPQADAVFSLVVTGATGGAPPDTTPPTTSVTSPANGATVSGTTTITCSASDNVGVTRVDFLVDGAVQGNDTTSPYSYAWNTTGATNGSHALRCEAYDAAGNKGTSATINVTVNNTSTPVTVTFTSIGAEDGRTWESSETSNVGGGSNATTTGADAIRVGDLTTDRSYRSILSFDTSSIPDGATVTAATLRLVRGTISGTNPFTILGTCQVDVRNGFFGTAATLANADFEAAATATAVASLSNPTANGSASSGTLNAAGLAAISKTGKTQFKIYFTIDDNDNNAYDYIGFYSGENATAANRPTLEVTYTP